MKWPADNSRPPGRPKKRGLWYGIISIIGSLIALGGVFQSQAVKDGTAPSATEALIAQRIRMADQGRNCADFSGEARKHCIRRALERNDR